MIGRLYWCKFYFQKVMRFDEQLCMTAKRDIITKVRGVLSTSQDDDGKLGTLQPDLVPVRDRNHI